MKTIIITAGSVASPFFQNEIPFILDAFDSHLIISYDISQKQKNDFFKKYNCNVVFIKEKNIFILFFPSFWKWFFSKTVFSEIKNILFTSNFIRKFLYIVFYGMYVVQTNKIINKYIYFTDNQIYLYAFWLSRPSYAITQFYDHSQVIKTITRAHGYDLYLERNELFYIPFRDFIFSRIGEIHFISENGLNYFRKKYFYSNTSLILSHLGTQPNIYRKKLIPKDHIVIVSCSSIIKIKRLDLIIDVIEYLSHKINIKWIHIGAGDLESFFIQKAEICIKDKFIFLGQISNDKIIGTYEKEDVDFFINLSDSEGIPVSMMEAISAGIPCIGRNVGGISELITKKNGLLLNTLFSLDFEKEVIFNFINTRITDYNCYMNYSAESFNTWKNFFDLSKNYPYFFDNIIGI